MSQYDLKPERRNGIDIEPRITVSNNYLRLTNKPKINGIELTGDKTSTDLNILTNDLTKYDELVLTDSSAKYVLVTGEDGETKKLRLSTLTTGKLSVTDDVTQVEAGNFIFKSMEEQTNGTDN